MPRCGLPVVNLIDLPDKHIDALMEEVFSSDQMRLYNYLASCCTVFNPKYAADDCSLVYPSSTHINIQHKAVQRYPLPKVELMDPSVVAEYLAIKRLIKEGFLTVSPEIIIRVKWEVGDGED